MGHGASRRAGVDPGRLAIGGDSAGGNLAAAVTLLRRDRGEPRLVAQLLVYPVTDYLSDTASLRDVTDPLLFNRDSVAWYWRHYLPGPQDGRNPLASPLRAADLGRLPRRWSSPPSMTRCETKGNATPTGCAPRACRSS